MRVRILENIFRYGVYQGSKCSNLDTSEEFYVYLKPEPKKLCDCIVENIKVVLYEGDVQ